MTHAIKQLRADIDELSRSVNTTISNARRLLAVDDAPLHNHGKPFEIKRAIAQGTTIKGYGSVFNVLDRHNEIVEPGAFHESIAEHQKAGTRPLMLWQHNHEEPIGVWEQLAEDATGLWVEGRLLQNVQRAQEAAALIEAGAIHGLSIGYRVVREQMDRSGIRHLLKLKLFEISIVSFAANQEARATVGKEYSAVEMRKAFDALKRQVDSFKIPSL